jgi:hypothetical protein
MAPRMTLEILRPELPKLFQLGLVSGVGPGRVAKQ